MGCSLSLRLKKRLDQYSLQSNSFFEEKLFTIKTEDLEKAQEDNKDVITKMEKVLEDRVEKIKISSRLTDSAACIVLNEQDMALYMQQLLKSNNIST